MQAVVLRGTPDRWRVQVGAINVPEDQVGRLVIEVAYAGISRMEPRWATSWSNADGTRREQPITLGLEYAGRVVSLGPEVEGFATGQKVLGMIDPYTGGAMAELVSSEAKYVLPSPDGLAFDIAAALPLSGQTAWQAIVRYGELRRSQRVLIHGGAGAVGTLAVQIARWIGAYIVITASEKDEHLCRSLGADEVVDFAHERFEDRGGDYDLVFDQIGGDTRARSWALLKRGGRLITSAGEEKDAPNQERARAMGVTARFFVVDRNNDELQRLIDLVDAGAVRPVISNKLDWQSVALAYEDGRETAAGKLMLHCAKSK